MNSLIPRPKWVINGKHRPWKAILKDGVKFHQYHVDYLKDLEKKIAEVESKISPNPDYVLTGARIELDRLKDVYVKLRKMDEKLLKEV